MWLPSGEVLMGKALVGVHADPSALRLLDEIRVLRARVAALEAELEAALAAAPPTPASPHGPSRAAEDAGSGAAARTQGEVAPA